MNWRDRRIWNEDHRERATVKRRGGQFWAILNDGTEELIDWDASDPDSMKARDDLTRRVKASYARKRRIEAANADPENRLTKNGAAASKRRKRQADGRWGNLPS